MSIQEQLDCLKKIKVNSTLTDKQKTEEMKKYLELLFKDNPLNLKYVPDEFKCIDFPIETQLAAYENKNEDGTTQLFVSNKSVQAAATRERIYYGDDRKGLPFSLHQLLNNMGHELRHCFQDKVDLSTVENEKERSFYQKIQEALRDDKHYQLSSTTSGAINALRWANPSEEPTLKTMPMLDSYIQALQNTYDGQVEMSYYLQHLHEEDARNGGFVYTQQLLKLYKKHLENQDEPELLDFINKELEQSKVQLEDNRNSKKEYIHYQNFKKIYDNVSFETIKEIQEKLNATGKKQEDLSFTYNIYSCLLDEYTDKYLEQLSPKQLEMVFLSNVYLFKEQDTFDQVSHLTETMLRKIITSELPEDKKKVLANHIYKHMLKNYKTYEFSRKDGMIADFYANGLLDAKQMKILSTKLGNAGKHYEAAYIWSQPMILGNNQSKQYSPEKSLQGFQTAVYHLDKERAKLNNSENIKTEEIQKNTSFLETVDGNLGRLDAYYGNQSQEFVKEYELLRKQIGLMINSNDQLAISSALHQLPKSKEIEKNISEYYSKLDSIGSNIESYRIKIKKQDQSEEKNQNDQNKRFVEEKSDQVAKLKIDLIDKIMAYADKYVDLPPEEYENMISVCCRIDLWMNETSNIGDMEKQVYKKQLEQKMEDLYQKQLNAYALSNGMEMKK